jgi:glycosyltransferase involved in cell wall biosynthesis
VVIPCHNEAANLGPLVEALRAVLDAGEPYEMVFTDDGSTDGTWSKLRELAAADARIRARRFAANRGKSAALWAGFQAARGSVIVTLDADLQNPPEDIPRLLEALRQNDCACGTRVQARARGDSWLRVASSRIGNWVRNRLTDETIQDAGCPFRAFHRRCLDRVKFYEGMHRFLPTLFRIEGFRVTEVPVGHRPRVAGPAHYGVWNRLAGPFADVLAVRWMKRRTIRWDTVEAVN